MLTLIALSLVLVLLLCNTYAQNRTFDLTVQREQQALYCKVQMECIPRSEKEIETLQREIQHYSKSAKYRNKIAEATASNKYVEGGPDSRAWSLLKFLGHHVIQPGQSLLDLGCAAGAIIKHLEAMYNKIGGHKHMAGVELVPGWIEAAKKAQPKHSFYVGDVTNHIPEITETFDVITMNDVMEHIVVGRYGCLFDALWQYSHPGTVVYMHVPTPAAQLFDQRSNKQYFENVVPQNLLIMGMVCAGFELEYFAYDHDANCHYSEASRYSHSGPKVSYMNARCREPEFNYPKYYHVLFRRPINEPIAAFLNKH